MQCVIIINFGTVKSPTQFENCKVNNKRLAKITKLVSPAKMILQVTDCYLIHVRVRCDVRQCLVLMSSINRHR